MNSTVESGWRHVLVRVFVHGALLAGAGWLLGLEQPVAGRPNLYSDYGLTESTQTLLLAGMVVCYLLSASLDKPLQTLALLFAGLCLGALLRESDWLLDKIYDGLWQWLVLIILCFCGYVVWRGRKTFNSVINEFTRLPAFGLLLSGFLVVFVFSRLYGTGDLWQRVMGEAYTHSIKNMAQEGVELLGYTLMFSAALELLWFVFRRRASGRDNDANVPPPTRPRRP